MCYGSLNTVSIIHKNKTMAEKYNFIVEKEEVFLSLIILVIK